MAAGPSLQADNSEEPPQPSRAVDRKAAVVSVVFGVLAILMAAATVLVEVWRIGPEEDADQASAGGLAGLLLFGVLTFFFGLAALIALFRALGMHRSDAALGMPEGSIRAFMALVLIMLFFLMAVFLYLDVARTSSERTLTGVDQTSYDSLVASGQVIAAVTYSVPDPEKPGEELQKWDVVLRSSRERSQVAEDIARQLVTVLGTLIVAIAAFYFGANSVQAASAAVGPSDTKELKSPPVG